MNAVIPLLPLLSSGNNAAYRSAIAAVANVVLMSLFCSTVPRSAYLQHCAFRAMSQRMNSEGEPIEHTHFEGRVSNVETTVKYLEKNMADKSEVTAIGQKVELLGIHLESGMKEMRSEMREMALNITSAQRDRFSQFYVRCLLLLLVSQDW